MNEQEQVRLAIMTGAGGVGKTTLAANLGYEVARKGHSVALLDLDPQGSLNVACRLNKTPANKKTTAWIYSGFFDGDYSAVPVWKDKVTGLEVIQGGNALFKIMSNLAQADGSRLLAQALEQYPLPHELVIFDCPATLETLPRTALVASTHILVPLVPDAKAIDGTRVLLDWYATSVREEKLGPPPKILGFVLNNVEKIAEHQRFCKQLPPMYEERGYRVFPPINHYAAFTNAWSEGIPLRVHRTTHPALQPLEEIVEAIEIEMG